MWFSGITLLTIDRLHRLQGGLYHVVTCKAFSAVEKQVDKESEEWRGEVRSEEREKEGLIVVSLTL